MNKELLEKFSKLTEEQQRELLGKIKIPTPEHTIIIDGVTTKCKDYVLATDNMSAEQQFRILDKYICEKVIPFIKKEDILDRMREEEMKDFIEKTKTLFGGEEDE